ncbi:MAG: hypothetical protein J1E16_01895 [Muribaculaceae bacterium]|nr:hypothetical protein [Muribaculaceae bacterium]
MNTEELIALTPPEFYVIQQKRRQENEKESARLKKYFRSLLLKVLKDDIEKEKLMICETRLAVSRLLRSERNRPIIIDISFAFSIPPTVRIIFPTGLEVEIEIMIRKMPALETRILPKDTNEFQRLKTYLSDWESRSNYLPGKREPDMVLFHTEDCIGKTIKEMCEITVSKIKDIVNGDIRLKN